MNKKIKGIVIAFLAAAMLQPSIAKARAVNYINDDSSEIWQEEDELGMVRNIRYWDVGNYAYNSDWDSFYFGFDLSGATQRDYYAVIEDSILGKPVTYVYYQEIADIEHEFPGIYIPDSVTALHNNTFMWMQFPHIYLPNSLREIPEFCFGRNRKLERLTLPANLKTIGNRAFKYCVKLNDVKIPEKVTAIEKEAFEGCTGLTRIYLPPSLKSIGKNVFKDCGELTIYCQKGSYAHRYAKKNKIKTKVVPGKKARAKEVIGLPSSIEVGTHEAYILFPFAEPFYATSQKFAYISSDPSVAEVNQNGKVEGKKEGSATITVMTTDGSRLQKEVKVAVKRGRAMVNPFFSLYQLKKGKTKYNADAMLYNRNPKATYEIYYWKSEGIAEARIVDGILEVTAKKEGHSMFGVFEVNGKKREEIGRFPISVINQKKVE